MAINTSEFNSELEAPNQQAKNITFEDITQDFVYVDWDRGNGDGCVLFINELGKTSATPEDGNFYKAGDIIKNTQCYSVGTTSFLNISGLDPNTSYEVVSYEYNEDGDQITYNKTQSSYQKFTTLDYPELELDITWDEEVPQTGKGIAFKKVSSLTTPIDVWKLTGPEERTFGLDTNTSSPTFNVTLNSNTCFKSLNFIQMRQSFNSRQPTKRLETALFQ